MADLRFLLRRMNQRQSMPRSGDLESAATTTLALMVGLVVLASIL
ncbi:hypothetical protein SAMN02949497_0723 [Methylomagnum ishizawai]|uniref:Uncharacterized protein n=1 Tax=Methylomagnum ishizawai TaxID=1760988 RepID=A0A1Y6CYP3_9GAMM|nr:hypothetical protein [Methylomagnum ishizawai]SMF93442.1 hypothetical protein SAMN02949497_0723 [Methylomagnum ishizawai]